MKPFLLYFGFFAVFVFKVVLSATVVSLCESECNGHGICVDGACTCFNGYIGADCSLIECPKGSIWFPTSNEISSLTSNPHLEESYCSNMGICDFSKGTCTCETGFGKDNCSEMDCPSKCSTHGRCLSLKLQPDAVESYEGYTYTNIWDSGMVRSCVCDDGWRGIDCSIPECPKGDDPYTLGQVDEEQEILCDCDGACSGGFYISFRGETTDLIAHDASDATVKASLQALHGIGEVSVAFSAGATVCDTAAVTTTVTFLTEHGELPVLSVYDVSLPGSSTLSSSVSVPGTKEWIECSGRGTCDSLWGTCTCFTGYENSDGKGNIAAIGDYLTRSDCGAVSASPPSTCPTDGSTCNAAGFCPTTGNNAKTCQCYDGYTGYKCDKRECPTGKHLLSGMSASDVAHDIEVECSGTGTCNTSTGVCSCEAGFEGDACQRFVCPDGDNTYQCSGHGQCKTIHEMMDSATLNGNPVIDKEVQLITCTATAGTFRIGLNGIWSAAIAYNAVATKNDESSGGVAGVSQIGDSVQSKLEDVSTIGQVTVEFLNSATVACSGSGSEIAITFEYKRGDQEMMWSDVTSLTGTAVITELQSGNVAFEYVASNGASYWDAEVIQGCDCDDGYTGFDCSIMSCPFGADPTQSGLNEIQKITCDAIGGFFRLSYKGQATGDIAFDAGATDIETALEGLSNIDNVSVAISGGGDDVCGAASIETFVEFLTEAGDLPLLKVHQPSIVTGGTISISDSTDGTKVLQECSNQGVCSTSTGRCTCFTGFSGSDGAGEPGIRDDCGYQLPWTTTS
eukprot:TRINITY_DN919_c0_g1_i1.p1 TRINITY_DN919_c0_g1~~TRINITY_DN919_c0_g1_i1.p1  ORF type:complete len:794 (+),score=144.49 TRINITY_DN919_c0_g1_i1:715-3096(+)